MGYSPEPRFRKNVKSYGFLSFAKKFGNKHGKKLNEYCNNGSSKYYILKSSSKNCRNCRGFDAK